MAIKDSTKSASYLRRRAIPNPFPAARTGEPALSCGTIDTPESRIGATIWPDGSLTCAHCMGAVGRKDLA